MNNGRVWVVVVLAVASLLVAGMPVASQGSSDGSVRFIGDSADPVVAAVLISQDAFPVDATTEGVVLAREDVFADALAGAALAGMARPILFTTGGPDAPLRPEVGEEIVRLLGGAHGCAVAPHGEVLVLGGTQAVSAAAVSAIEASGYCVRRFAGASRVETSVLIAEAVIARSGGEAAGPLLVSRDDNFADAATGGALAARQGLPLVVTPTGALHPAVIDLLTQGGVSSAVLLGGTAALSAEVAGALEDAVGLVGRLAGPSRDATAAAIAAGPWRHEPVAGVTLVGGFAPDGFTYAIASAVTAAREAAPQLYVQPDSVPASTAEVIAGYAQRGVRDVIVVGPAEAVGEEVAAEAAGVAADPPPLREPLVAFTVTSADVDQRGIYIADAADGLGVRRLVEGSVGIPGWTDDGRALVVPIADSTVGADGVVQVGLDGTVTQLILFGDSKGFAQDAKGEERVPLRLPEGGNAFRSTASPWGAFPAGRFLAVDQTRIGADGKGVRELVVYDTLRERCAGDGVCAIAVPPLPSPQYRLAGRYPWLDSTRLLLIEGGQLVVLELATRRARRTGVAANHVTVSVGSTVFVSTDGQTTIYDADELTMPGSDLARPPTFEVGGGEVAVVITAGPPMTREVQFAVLIEGTNRDVYVASLDRDDPPVRLLRGDVRETFGLDAGSLEETFVITSISSDKVVGQLVRPGQEDTPPEVFADWEITPDNGPEGRRFSVEIQPRGGL